MKLHILNDLHIEFGDFSIPETDADVIVLAGDIGVGQQGLDWLHSQAIDKPIIYVPGNHEFYHHDLDLLDDLKSSAAENVHVLNDDLVEIDGVRFLGSVLWTDFSVSGEAERYFAMHNARKNMSDFSLIRFGGRRFQPEDSVRLHESSRDWIGNMLSGSYPGKTVVVTHHAPSSCSIHPRYARSILNPAFASNLEHLMDDGRVDLWVHGHMHDAFDYDVYGTRVVCNPRGYVGYGTAENFVPNLVIEI